MYLKSAFVLTVLGAFLFMFASISPVMAQETGSDGEIEMEEGISAFEEGDWATALSRFTAAAKADPENAAIHHYRGMTLLKLDQPEEALKVLLKARELDPNARDINLDVGQVYQQLGRNDEAEAAYRRETNNYPDNAQAHFSLGYLLLVGQKYDECIPSLERAGELDPNLAAVVAYYKGVAHYKSGDFSKAEGDFRLALQLNPAPKVKDSASKYLEVISGQKKRLKNWGVVLSIIYQYDNNVIAASDQARFPLVIEDEEISDKEDSRGVVMLSAFYKYTRVKPWILGGGYSFYQSFHSDIDMYNLQNHSPSLSLSRRQKIMDKDTSIGLDYSFGAAFLGTDTELFSTNHWVTPSFGVFWTKTFATAVGYRFNAEDFDEDEPDRDNTAHSGFARVDWVFLNNRASLTGVAGYDVEDADDPAYNIRRPWVKLTLGTALPYEFKTKLGFRYEFEDHYDDDVQDRQDDIYSLEFVVTRPVWGPLEATAGVNYRDNRSNVDSLKYDRTIVGGGLIARF